MKTTSLCSTRTTIPTLRNLTAVLALLLGAGTAVAWEPEIDCQDNYSGAMEIDIPVVDTKSGLPDIAHGLYAAPEAAPTHLVVIGHGAGHTIESWRRHAEMLANDYGYLVVAMEYRDMIRRADNEKFFEVYENMDPPSEPKPEQLHHDWDGDKQLPKADGWPVRKGGEDLNAAARAFLKACPGVQTTVLTGISMGVSMTGWALAQKPKRRDGTALYDYWLAIEGVHNLTESYFEDRAVNEKRSEDGFTHTRFIEEEAGGGELAEDESRKRVAFEDDSDPYYERTNILQYERIQEAGLRRVFYVHATYDGLVPYWQSRAMADRMSRVPREFYTVTLRLQGEDGTVLEDHAIEEQPIDFESPLAGHAKESNGEHVVMRASFDRLADLIYNVDRQCGEYLSYDMVNPDSTETLGTSQVVSTPIPGLTHDCAEVPPRGRPTPTGGGKAKGSGWLPASDNKKINFSFKVDSDNNSDSDSDSDNKLSLRDKQAGVKIKIKDVTAIGGITGTCGSIEAGPQSIEFHGTGTYNDDPAAFRVCVEDNGKSKKEPRDRFVLSCLEGCSYSTSGRAIDQLGGGNIKIYRSAEAGESGGSESAEEADIIFLGPLLDDEVLPGSIINLEVSAVDGHGQPLANALVNFRFEYADRTSQSFAATTNVSGVGVLPVQLTVHSVNVVATSGASSSNWIAFSTFAY
ncbi:MAG: hypothetical protein HKN35_07205 [Woeseia sp.]|nr:hypothetical protein [Woeseia sp.]MBT8097761.1 hypothetical protein [Woeseia sp.]NNE60663.1 hypothetical protein [Woeseia sp.]NNL54964.1 hypothetical protein [Woeseia sp.]